MTDILPGSVKASREMKRFGLHPQRAYCLTAGTKESPTKNIQNSESMSYTQVQRPMSKIRDWPRRGEKAISISNPISSSKGQRKDLI